LARIRFGERILSHSVLSSSETAAENSEEDNGDYSIIHVRNIRRNVTTFNILEQQVERRKKSWKAADQKPFCAYRNRGHVCASASIPAPAINHQRLTLGDNNRVKNGAVRA